MRNRILHLSVLAIFISIFLPGQTTGQNRVAYLIGQVQDRATSSPIAQVILQLRETKVQTESDSAGRFYLPLPPGMSAMLVARRWGYHNYQRYLPATAASDTLKIILSLWPNPIVLPEVIVAAEKVRLAEPLQTSRTAEIALRQPGGFEDPLRTLQQLPGVTLRSDWDSQISVRGATPDQTLVVVDGFTLPNPYRLQFALGGGMSLVNLGILRSAGLWKSGFSPRFGDRLAGLVVFETKSALEEKLRELRLNVFDAGLNLAFPVVRNRTGVLMTARRNYHDAVEKFVPLHDFAVPRWQDVQIKATHQFSPRHQAEMLVIGSKEWTELRLSKLSQGEINERSETLFTGLVYRWVASPHKMWENYFSHSQSPSRLRYFSMKDELIADYHFTDRAWQWRSELSLQYGNQWQWLLGMESVWQRQWADLRFGATSADNPLALPENFRGKRWRRLMGAFVESRFTLHEALVLRPGLRLAGQNVNENLNAEPRVTLAGKMWRGHYRLHGGLYYQTLDWQSLFRREWPMEVKNWRDLPIERAALYSLDFSLDLGWGIQWAAGAYFRRMDPLLVPIDESEGTTLEFRANNLGASQPAELMANRPRVTRGKQSGIELALSKFAPGWQLNLQYAYSRSSMRDLDDTQWIAAATDRPHDLAGALSGNLGSYLKLNSFFRYSSGNPYTPALSILRDLNHWRWPSFYRFVYAPRNSSRYPDYFRIDLRVTFGTVILGASGEFYLEWMNVTNHRNVYQILWAGDLEEGAAVLKNVQQHRILMLPRLVVGGMALRF